MISTVSILSVNRPSSIRENSSNSSTIWARRLPSLTMMARPWRYSSGSVISPDSSVSPQPLIAVSGVRSSWETEEINSLFIRSFWLILSDMSLIASVSCPISSSYCFSIWMP